MSAEAMDTAFLTEIRGGKYISVVDHRQFIL
ncbi:hypothetical protein ABIC86_001474 [Paenibacillus sp. DS2363]